MPSHAPLLRPSTPSDIPAIAAIYAWHVENSTATFKAAGWKFGRWLDVVLMQRTLGLGDGAPPVQAP